MPSAIRTAVVPAAGQGTRMLPATKAVPKELLPILEQPALQFIVDEAVGAGVDHVVIVTSRAKPAIEAYFERNELVESILDKQGRGGLADRLRRYGSEVRVSFVYQDEPLGLGHAVACARPAVGDEPFFVLLPDELMGDSSLLSSLGSVVEATGVPAIALKRMEQKELFRYGVVDPVGDVRSVGGADVVPFASVVEKPSGEAPSDLVIIGRYALLPDVFDVLANLAPSASGEIQLSDALSVQASRHPLNGVMSNVSRRDIGNPVGWLQAVVEAGLEHAEYGPAFTAWLAQR